MLDESALFATLKDKSCELYFPGGTIFFGESLADCYVYMTDASNQMVDDMCSIKAHLDEKGLYVSKTCFILHSKCKEVNLLNDILPACNCPNCNTPLFDETCFVCILNQNTQNTQIDSSATTGCSQQPVKNPLDIPSSHVGSLKDFFLHIFKKIWTFPTIY